MRGVPNVVCWETRANDNAARIFSEAFFHALKCNGRNDYEHAFEQARRKLSTTQGEGAVSDKKGNKRASSMYELRDPDAPAIRKRSGAPAAAGIPVLLNAKTEKNSPVPLKNKKGKQPVQEPPLLRKAKSSVEVM